MGAKAVTLRFQYFEITDQDHTLIWAEVIEKGEVTHAFTNYPDRWGVSRRVEVYGNQSEEFHFPTKEAALAMLRSNPVYREVHGGWPWQLASLEMA